ncbi:MAG TPA: hypothetical protein VIM07_15890 [Chitinophagaceae bacterium]
MPFSILLIGVFIIKGILLWIFYSKQGWKPLLVGLVSSIAYYSLMTVLYHDTDVDFWLVLLVLMIFDVFVYNLLLKKSIAKSIIVSFCLNLIAIIFFLFANG